MKLDEQRLFDAAARRDLTLFAWLVCGNAHTARPIKWRWYHNAICHHLQQVFDGKIRRLIINVPPRHLKSWIASVAFPAFVLGHQPSAKVVCMSYSAELGSVFARNCRDAMRAEFYQALFPNSEIHRDRHAAHDFNTTERGSRSTMSFGGTITGRGGQYVIIDDPMKPEEVLSDVQRASILQRFDNTVYTRLDEKKSDAIVIVMQRLHVEDLVGHVLAKGDDWVVLSLPAIALEDETIPTGTGQVYKRKAGELLDAEREPLEILDQLKRDLGSAAFAAQYQQSPVPPSGNIFKTEWLKTYNYPDAPERWDFVFQSWDIGMKDHDSADFSVGTTWGVLNERYYLIDLYRLRCGFPELARKIAKEHRQYPGSTLLIEEAGSGTGLIQVLSEDGIHAIGIKPTQDKISRANIVTPIFEAGRVLFPDFLPFLDDLRNEMLAFPRGRNDDQVDSIVQALNWHQEHIRYPNTPLFGRY